MTGRRLALIKRYLTIHCTDWILRQDLLIRYKHEIYFTTYVPSIKDPQIDIFNSAMSAGGAGVRSQNNDSCKRAFITPIFYVHQTNSLPSICLQEIASSHNVIHNTQSLSGDTDTDEALSKSKYISISNLIEEGIYILAPYLILMAFVSSCLTLQSRPR